MMDKVKKIVDCLRRYDPERIILFGSYAREEADEYSDVDLVIIKETEERFLDRIHSALKCWNLPLALDVLVYTPEEFSRMLAEENGFILEVMEEGKVIYEKGPNG